jgi:hypothetical protein
MFRYWLRIGIKAGWISKPYCMTHDGNYEYMSEEEREKSGTRVMIRATLLYLY